MIMVLLEDGAAKGFIVGNIDVTLVDENACIDLPVRKVGMEWEGNILIHRLESLEDKGIASGGRFNVVGESHINNIVTAQHA